MNIDKWIEANKEITELKDQLANQELVNDRISALADAKVEHLAKECDELKAMVESQREALTMISDQVKHGFVICTVCSHQDSTEHHDTLWMANDALNKTREQSLTDVKAAAIRDAISNSEQIELAGQVMLAPTLALKI